MLEISLYIVLHWQQLLFFFNASISLNGLLNFETGHIGVFFLQKFYNRTVYHTANVLSAEIADKRLQTKSTDNLQ